MGKGGLGLTAQQRQGGFGRTRFQPAELDDPGTAQPFGHGRGDKFARRHHGGARWAALGILEDDVVAAFGFQRHVDPQFAHERFRPDTSRQQHVIAGQGALIGEDRSDLLVGDRHVLHLGLPDGAANPPESLGQSPNIAAGVGDEAVVGQPCDAGDLRTIGRVEFPDRAAFDDVRLETRLAAQRPGVGLSLKGSAVGIGKAIVAVANPVLQPQIGAEGFVLRHAVAHDGHQPGRDAAGIAVIGVGHVAAQPWQQAGQIGPAQEQRKLRVAQHPR